jgi:putative peptide zinc metalloprotease protein
MRSHTDSEALAAVPAVRLGADGPRLDQASRLRLVSLSVRPRGDELLVGDALTGEFVVLPPIAGVVLDQLGAGVSLAQVSARTREAAGEDVDVLDFAATLIDLGFVTHVDDRPLPEGRSRLHDGGRCGERLATLGRPLFSRTAWVV